MKNIRKVLFLAICAVLVVVGSVLGTLAYLTDTEAVTNTFTVGSVGLNLDETDAKPDGTKESDNRVKANEYHLLPGHTYIKDPTVTVDAGSEEAYIRMILTINKQDALDGIFAEINEGKRDPITIQDVLTGWASDKWIPAGETEVGDERVYEFRYHQTVAKSEDPTKLEPLFTAIQMPGDITKEHLAELYSNNNIDDDLKITVVAHAIQAAGFDTADLAWASFDAQNS